LDGPGSTPSLPDARVVGLILAPRSRSELVITLIDDSAIAAAPMIGESSSPQNGQSARERRQARPLTERPANPLTQVKSAPHARRVACAV
jgi:hypothetical protein